ncbi:MAG: hypothetical protein HOE11_03505 [Candidatus Diapherotrites archaeon]|jgi:hypothetical protein|nr:hypothetical protein [Candidatus Diapherotrites archaeon]
MPKHQKFIRRDKNRKKPRYDTKQQQEKTLARRIALLKSRIADPKKDETSKNALRKQLKNLRGN